MYVNTSGSERDTLLILFIHDLGKPNFSERLASIIVDLECILFSIDETDCSHAQYRYNDCPIEYLLLLDAPNTNAHSGNCGLRHGTE
jgi:hypothetical protein